MDTHAIDSFINHFVTELDAGTAAVFVGAGLSSGSGYVDWVGLLEGIAKELRLDAKKESAHLVSLAQYHVNAKKNRATLNRVVIPPQSSGPQKWNFLVRFPEEVP
jgi:hypothetical protein